MKSMLDELTRYRVKVEREGKEILNVPGILTLPGMLVAPKMSIIGMFVAPLLGCSIHLVNADGKGVDVGEKVRKAANTVAETASTAAKTVREEMDKAWDALSADDPEGCPVGTENEPDETGSDEHPAGNTVEEIVEDLEKHETEGIPVIHVENPNKPE